jgi:hypothetical protein
LSKVDILFLFGHASFSHGAVEAERLAVEALADLGVSSERKDLEGMKVLVAAMLGKRTAVANGWNAERLRMCAIGR